MQARTTRGSGSLGGAQAEDGGSSAPARRPARERVRARLRGDYEEDGVFRPVRLSVWADLAASALILLVAAAGFVGFFVWLARAQRR